MELDLDDFAATVEARAPQLHNIGSNGSYTEAPPTTSPQPGSTAPTAISSAG